ncbi:hypothetical protein F5H01DRAFT_181768 [Linnemannia elongata]|nr:hypothetical protein F5H01DRAFT_181768 [Linnemannia elongata]
MSLFLPLNSRTFAASLFLCSTVYVNQVFFFFSFRGLTQNKDTIGCPKGQSLLRPFRCSNKGDDDFFSPFFSPSLPLPLSLLLSLPSFFLLPPSTPLLLCQKKTQIKHSLHIHLALPAQTQHPFNCSLFSTSN